MRDPALLTSWIIINWKLVYYLLLNNDKVITKITFIEKNYTEFSQIFCWPAAFSLIYILFYPTISNLSSFIWAITDKLSKQFTALYIEKKIPLYEEDKSNILNTMREQAIKFEDERKNLKGQIDTLNSALASFAKPYQSKNQDESDSKQQDPETTEHQIVSNLKFTSGIFDNLNTTKSKYLLNESMAKLFYMNIDRDGDKADIQTYCEIYKSIVKAYPAPFEPQAIRSGGTNIDLTRVKLFLTRMITRDLIKEFDSQSNSVKLTDSGKQVSLKIIENNL
jgi:hypothetical protein